MGNRFPLYQILVNGHSHMYTLSEAAAAYDSGWARVTIGEVVIDEGGNERKITEEDKTRIAHLADEYSGNK